MKYIDSHCHPNNADLRGEAAAVFERARAAGVLKMGVIGSDLADSIEAVELSRAYAEYGLFPVVGVHPHEARTMPGLLLRFFTARGAAVVPHRAAGGGQSAEQDGGLPCARRL